MLRLTIRKAFTEPMANFFSTAITSMLPGFAVGTDYVPQDMVARIHKGERIIPAAQNATSGGSGQSINISINATVGDVASKADVVAGMRATANQIAAQISRSQHYGGAMA
jgi:hypothetical protein